MKTAARAAAACVWLLLLQGIAAGAGPKISGYFKNYSIVFLPAPVPGGPGRRPLGLASNRLRLQLFEQASNSISLEAAYAIDPRIQAPSFNDQLLLFSEINPFVYRVADLDRRLYPSESSPPGSFEVDQNLDRASITLHTRRADVVLGRQAIAWGSAQVVNPTDVLAPFTFETLDTEYRIGVDAARVRVPLGPLAEIDTGYVFGKDFKFENSAFFTRTRFNVLQTDIALLAMDFRENLMAGFDAARSIGGAGVYLEAAYVFVHALDRYDRGLDYLRVSTGLDYSLTSKTLAFVEYHFNGAGSSNPAQYPAELSSPAYREGGVYLMGRHYVAPGVTYQLTPLITLTGQALVNVTDPSAFLAPSLQYNLAPNVYLEGGGFIGTGSRPRIPAGGTEPVLTSEFGGYPDFFYGSFQIYF